MTHQQNKAGVFTTACAMVFALSVLSMGFTKKPFDIMGTWISKDCVLSKLVFQEDSTVHFYITPPLGKDEFLSSSHTFRVIEDIKGDTAYVHFGHNSMQDSTKMSLIRKRIYFSFDHTYRDPSDGKMIQEHCNCTFRKK